MPNSSSIPYPAWNEVPEGRRHFILMLQLEEDDWRARRPKDPLKESLEDMKYQIFSQLIDVENILRKQFHETLNAQYNHVEHTVEEIKHVIRRENQADVVDKTLPKVKPKLIYPVPFFDGKNSVDIYIRQFNLISKLNKWTDDEKVGHLISAIHGSATSSLSFLKEKPDLCNLQKQLRRFFTKKSDSSNPYEKIFFLERLGTEKKSLSVMQLSQSLDIIGDGLPKGSQALIDHLQVHYFMRGITNVSLQRRLANEQYMSLNSVLDAAGVR